MKKNQHEKVKSLRLCHLGIASLSALGILAVLFIDNWGDNIVWLCIISAVFFDGKLEKSDELAKVNIRKADSITMWFLFASLVYFMMFARFHTISTSMVIIVALLALAIRSCLFLIFDTALIGENKSNG